MRNFVLFAAALAGLAIAVDTADARPRRGVVYTTSSYPAYTYSYAVPTTTYYSTPAYTYDSGVAPATYVDRGYYDATYPSYYTTGYYTTPGFYSPAFSVNRYGTRMGGTYVRFR